MALINKSLFLYGFHVTELNSSLDFRAISAETPRLATLRLGYYSLTSLLEEIVIALTAADPDNLYFATANRTIAGGLQNRVTVFTTTGTFFELLFSSGPRASSSINPLIGFNSVDYSGFLTYTGSVTCGTTLQPTLVGYNYLSPDFMHKVFGSVNVSASGLKESIVFQIQKFWQVQFKFEPEAFVVSDWKPLLDWATQQRLLEFTPNISFPDTFFEGYLEQTGADNKALGYTMQEMLPDFPFLYDTGQMKFRVRAV